MRYRPATFGDLINPPILFPFFITIKSLGVKRMLCFSQGICRVSEFPETDIFLMSVPQKDAETFLKTEAREIVSSLVIKCSLEQIEVAIPKAKRSRKTTKKD